MQCWCFLVFVVRCDICRQFPKYTGDMWKLFSSKPFKFSVPLGQRAPKSRLSIRVMLNIDFLRSLFSNRPKWLWC